MKDNDHNKIMVDKVWKEIGGLSNTELARLLKAYDEYVWQIITENESTPVGVAEFYQYDYQEYWESEKVNKRY